MNELTEVRTVCAFNAGKQAAKRGKSILECPDFFMPYYPHWLDGYKTEVPVLKINTVGDLVHQLSCYDDATLLDRSYTIKVNDNGDLQLEVIE